jgi:major membrane immunogen (membrane-anchored lipoprotein)
MEKYMKKAIAAILLILTAAAVCTGCGGGSKSYKDGTYTAQSSLYESMSDDEEDEGGEGYGVVTITLKDNVITDCEFTTYMPDGTVKDAEYGKEDGEIANQDYYNKAQRAVKGSQKYAEQLVEKGKLGDVEAVSGATISYNEFMEAVGLALKDAEE